MPSLPFLSYLKRLFRRNVSKKPFAQDALVQTQLHTSETTDDKIIPPESTVMALRADTSAEDEETRAKRLAEIYAEERAGHEGFMMEALALAEKALREDETPVGCVFVHEGVIIAGGANETNISLNGTRHAEFVALEKIIAQHGPAILHETDLYVTVEPCIMCASALRQYGIHAVYYGCTNDKFGGTGGVMNIHSDPSVDPGYEVFGGLFRAEAIMLLRKFYVQQNEKAPEPHKKTNRVLKEYIEPAAKA